MKSAASVKWIITKIGRDLPDRERIPATKTTRVKMEPAGALWTTHGIDTYKVVGEVDKSKNNLEGKKLVLLFGKESHPLTRLFMVPKLSVIYQNITLSDKDIEFLYVGLDGQTKQEYDRFAASMCCCWIVSCLCALLPELGVALALNTSLTKYPATCFWLSPSFLLSSMALGSL